MAKTTPAGWYPDTDNAGMERYWDGESWSDQRRPDVSPSKSRGGVLTLWMCLVAGALAYVGGAFLVVYSWRNVFSDSLSLDESGSTALQLGVILGGLLVSFGTALAFVGLIGFGVKLGREAANV